MTDTGLKEKALKRKLVKAEYNAPEPEFSLLRGMLTARKKSGLSQSGVAKRMGTKPPAVTRLESSLSSGRHSPSIATLKKYADAVGYHLVIKLVRN